ncbi:hypothetical protein [Candidatus Pantoea persica]|uniref:hypothetical protein n=1 Tax=Candidatus Pantoea persica TaxID=2518128 RepID=UPI00215D92B5|nr:hypothetical protein [Candidatus Pantoea persica]
MSIIAGNSADGSLSRLNLAAGAGGKVMHAECGICRFFLHPFEEYRANISDASLFSLYQSMPASNILALQHFCRANAIVKSKLSFDYLLFGLFHSEPHHSVRCW